MPVAIFAKAPIAGYAKTRLAAHLGADGAADLQARLIERTVATVLAARIGSVALWCAPDASHPLFRRLAESHGIAHFDQEGADLGQRMHRAFAAAAGPLIVVGTDCPALEPRHLTRCADVLAAGWDAVVLPSEDGGYVLIGLARPEPALFRGVEWGAANVMDETRRRLESAGLAWREPATLWDLDRPDDHARAVALGMI